MPLSPLSEFYSQGYQRSGSGFTDPDGNYLSRRQMDDFRAIDAGYNSAEEYRSFTRDPEYQTWLAGVDHEDPESVRDFNHLYAAYRQDLEDRGVTSWRDGDTSPDGPLARLLVDLGYRDEDDDWDVGDTPSQGEN